MTGRQEEVHSDCGAVYYSPAEISSPSFGRSDVWSDACRGSGLLCLTAIFTIVVELFLTLGRVRVRGSRSAVYYQMLAHHIFFRAVLCSVHDSCSHLASRPI